MKFDRRELFFIPNILSIIRLILMPLPIWMIAHGHDNIALALVLFGMLTDVLDGYLARRLNQVSDLGKILDPLSDKLAIGGLVVTLVIYRGFPLWAAILIITRDLLVLFGSIFLISKQSQAPMSNLFGKLTAITWGALVVSYLTPFTGLQQIFLYLAVIMAPISFAIYLIRLKRL